MLAADVALSRGWCLRELGDEDGAAAAFQACVVDGQVLPAAREAIGNPRLRLVVTDAETIATRTDKWDTTTETSREQRDAAALADEQQAVLDTAQARLDELIGLEGPKEQIAVWRTDIQIDQLLAAQGQETSATNENHMVLEGPPGTAKTTFAHRRRNPVQAGQNPAPGGQGGHREDIVVGYVSQTAERMKAVCEEALGGVLFIDEAYRLACGDRAFPATGGLKMIPRIAATVSRLVKTGASVAARLAEGGASVLGVRYGTAEPRFVVERETAGLQIRRYGPRIAAETTVDADNEAAARNAGFRRLAGYIFGGNHESARIAMTAPVTQEPSDARSGQKIAMTAPVAQAVAADDAWVIRFFMPADHSMETLPAPNDPAVKLVTVPAETVAVLRFTGDRGPEAVASHTADLLHALQDTTLEPDGPPVAWFYDPPWTIPMLRRNEIAVPVMQR